MCMRLPFPALTDKQDTREQKEKEMMNRPYIATEYKSVPLNELQQGEMFTVRRNEQGTQSTVYMMPDLRQKLPGGLMSVVCMDGLSQAMLLEDQQVHRVLEVHFKRKR